MCFHARRFKNDSFSKRALTVGLMVGLSVGKTMGASVGALVGLRVGLRVTGLGVGWDVEESVGSRCIVVILAR